ncbi:tetratricopeptide repeat protein [Flavobacteriaceae bacterium TP-CH-4]|uniref:Tetratricopeptide repeat protein n=1 Tax=Pelagihabitans pacificus TaxID=2696054 RepID=A0A967ASL6_9FLAO|nr:tetratricopeptide repeat protein [Pelagihabitans pacificus]NHF58465.1 tetratricopeptide repeat protein [Pelagihabitans pacificus]
MRIFSILFMFNLFFACAQTSIKFSSDQNLKIADSLYTIGNYTAAINFYAKVGSQNSNLQIARVYNAMGNYDKAIDQYRDVVGKDLGLEIARFELGKLYLKTKQFDEARKIFSYLVSTNKTNPEYRYYQGEAFRELDQIASSLVAYKKAVDLDSTHLRSLFRLGKYYTVKLERGAALKYVNRGLEFYKNDVALVNLKALILYNDDQFENAIPWFEKVLELGEKKEYIYSKLAYCYYKNWEFDKAKAMYRILSAIDDTNPDAYFGLGSVYLRNKQLDSAEINFKTAIEVKDPALDREYNALASLARERNDLKSALEYYRLAYQEDTTSSTGYYQVCTVADQYYEDPKIRLEYYENFLRKFGKEVPYLSKTVLRRIRELKEELHYKRD